MQKEAKKPISLSLEKSLNIHNLHIHNPGLKPLSRNLDLALAIITPGVCISPTYIKVGINLDKLVSGNV